MRRSAEILADAPGAVTLGVSELAAAIDGCMDAAQTCTSCADASLAEDDVAPLRTCIALCENCADLCAGTARILSRPAHSDHLLLHRLLQACVRACATCAEECARHADHHRHCEICAKACRRCLQACTELLDVQAFEELEKLAGG
jgi:hypothetical protein